VPLAAPVLGSRKVEVFAKDVQEHGAGGDFQGPGLAVDVEGDGNGVHPWGITSPAVGSIAADLRGALSESSYLLVGIQQISRRGGPGEAGGLRLAQGLHGLAPVPVVERVGKGPRQRVLIRRIDQ
jgi:hypothetical protein